jgi:hypothetical protein
MSPKLLGKQVEKLGSVLMMIGGVCIVGIFLAVLVNGSWPDYLSPVQAHARAISDVVGGLVWLAWVAAFIGPGFLVQLLGHWLQSE